MSLTSVDLPDPLTPVTAVRTPSGNETVTFCRLFTGAVDDELAPRRPGTPHSWSLDLDPAAQVGARQRVGAVQEVVEDA